MFKIFPDLQEFSSGDLFSPHPADAKLWQYRGRSDELQVFRSGEKYHPAALEQQLEIRSEVARELLVGTGRPQAALLLEMKQGTPLETPQQREEVLLRLWSPIEEFNQMRPEYGRLNRELTMILSPAKRMGRGARGTVQRSLTVELYEKGLDLISAKNMATA